MLDSKFSFSDPSVGLPQVSANVLVGVLNSKLTEAASCSSQRTAQIEVDKWRGRLMAATPPDHHFKGRALSFSTTDPEDITTHILEGVEGARLYRRVRLSVPEEHIIYELNAVVAAHPDVSFGSYPVSQSDCQTIITIEAAGDGEAQLEAGLASLLAALPKDAIVEVSDRTSLLRDAP